MRIIWLLLSLVGLPLMAQQINPTNQINWPKATGSGAPTASCTVANYGQPYINTATNPNQNYTCGSFGWALNTGSSTTPASPAHSIQLANTGVTGFQADSNFTIDPTTHTRTSTANDVVYALSSTPRAIYDPMDTNTKYDGGLAAAIAGTSGFTPTQVIQAAIDYGECQLQQGLTQYQGIEIPLPNYVTINIAGLKLWSNTSLGGDPYTFGPRLQHNDSSQIMIQGHAPSDTITCNGTVYTPSPGGTGGMFVHNVTIAGMFAPNTDTDIGILLNCSACAAEDIAGTGNAFGSPAIISTGTSAFILRAGFPGAQMQGCKTYNNGIRPVSGFTLGFGHCASVQNGSLDGGMENVYASDGQAFASGHAAGPCYPNCAAISAGGSGSYNNNLFAQVSGVGVALNGANIKVGTVRVDDTSREAVQVTGGAMVDQIVIDSPCVDTALSASYTAGTATGCYAVVQSSGSGAVVQELNVVNNAGIFSQSYIQAWIEDTAQGFSGTSNIWAMVRYQGNPNNTTANNWMIWNPNNTNDQTGSRVVFPAMSPMQATGATINASGVNAVRLNGQTVTNIIGGVAGQRLTVVGNGTVNQASGINNLNSLPATVTCGADQRSCSNALEYVSTTSTNGNIWVMLSGPPNQTPTHVNYFGNPTPSNPSLVDVYGNVQARQAPAFTITSGIQLHGAVAPSGQACFEQENKYPDGSRVVSALSCTTIDLAAQSAGEIFVTTTPQTTQTLWLVSNTEPSAVAIGKFAAPTGTFWDGPTTIAAGGDGTTAPPAGDNPTGQSWNVGVKATCPSPLPTCNASYHSLICTVPGSGATADVWQRCNYNGSTYSWTAF